MGAHHLGAMEGKMQLVLEALGADVVLEEVRGRERRGTLRKAPNNLVIKNMYVSFRNQSNMIKYLNLTGHELETDIWTARRRDPHLA